MSAGKSAAKSGRRAAGGVAGLLSKGEVNLDEALEKDLKPLAGKSVLIVGDLILDHYLWGDVERTTPEAPVPIVRHERDSWGLGGAANVAQNVAALGGKALPVGVVGGDEEGERLKSKLRAAGISAGGAIKVPGRPTTLKTRVMSMGQQLLRIDREDVSPLPPEIVDKLIAAIRRSAKRCGAMLLSDYAKGVLGPKVIAAAIQAGRDRGIPVLVDPKGHDYLKYRGADLLTPNLREASLAVGAPITDEEELRRAGRKLIKLCGLKALTITLGPEGMAVIRPRGKVIRIPARAREVFDVTGAGDTSIATLTLGLAAGLGLDDAATLANHAGGIVVGKLGVATVSPVELKTALAGGDVPHKIRSIEELKGILANQQTNGRKVVFTNGCFDLLHPGHIQFLHEARRLGDMLVVGLNTDRSVRALEGPRRPILPQNERAAILSALEVVDYIVFFNDLTPEPLLRELRPDVLVKGRNIPRDKVVGRNIVESYGGKVRRLPIMRSSSVADLVDSIVGKKSGRAKDEERRTN